MMIVLDPSWSVMLDMESEICPLGTLLIPFDKEPSSSKCVVLVQLLFRLVLEISCSEFPFCYLRALVLSKFPVLCDCDRLLPLLLHNRNFERMRSKLGESTKVMAMMTMGGGDGRRKMQKRQPNATVHDTPK